jgi:tetratricopeptide (TPR) repeat protein
MKCLQMKMLRKLKTQTYSVIAVLAMALLVLAGCAIDGNVKKPAASEPSIANEPSMNTEPSVERFNDGREGFIITEVPKMDKASRKDFNRAVAILEEKDYGKAIGLLEKIIEQSPGVTAPYIDIAIAYERIGKPEKAEEYLKTALKLFPAHPAACNEYGLLYRRTGRFADARAIYEKAIERFPEYYPAHKNLGILCDLYLNDPACAIEHYEIYSKARPDDKQVKLWIADLRARLDLSKEGK